VKTVLFLSGLLAVGFVSAFAFYSHSGKPTVNGEFLKDWTPQDESLSQKYPYFLLTPTYGIVNEADLQADKTHYTATPFDGVREAMGAHWQCFPTKIVTPHFDSWKGPDGMGKTGIVYSMCERWIDVQRDRVLDRYVDRRAHQAVICRDFIKYWKKLTRDEPVVCLSGEAFDRKIEIDKGIEKTERLWTWNQFKTKKGSYCYFGGADCGTDFQ
jgi:hypothetical protein